MISQLREVTNNTLNAPTSENNSKTSLPQQPIESIHELLLVNANECIDFK